MSAPRRDAAARVEEGVGGHGLGALGRGESAKGSAPLVMVNPAAAARARQHEGHVPAGHARAIAVVDLPDGVRFVGGTGAAAGGVPVRCPQGRTRPAATQARWLVRQSGRGWPANAGSCRKAALARRAPLRLSPPAARPRAGSAPAPGAPGAGAPTHHQTLLSLTAVSPWNPFSPHRRGRARGHPSGS